MRKPPFAYNTWLFRVAQAKLAPQKVRLEKLATGVSKLCIVWLSRLSSLAWISDMHLSDRSRDFFHYRMSNCPSSVTSISSESSDTFPFGVDDETRPGSRKRATQLYSTAYNSFHVPDVHVVCCLHTIIVSYLAWAGHNSVVRRPKHCSLPAYDEVIARIRYDIRQNMRAWLCFQTCRVIVV